MPNAVDKDGNIYEGYHRDITTWGSYDGRKVLVKDLDTPHVVNILNWIKNSMDKSESQYSLALYQLFEDEAAIRMLEGFADNKPYPRKQKDGYYKLSNVTRHQQFTNWIRLQYHRFKMKKASKSFLFDIKSNIKKRMGK